ncbi:hypothetical protein [Streptomyces sp. NPDC057062]|uniref:hypothetical protein n=1 Tax=Streptomyces sp. NPDC057062 TaxID=3346011 RepID=UPI0036D3AFE2
MKSVDPTNLTKATEALLTQKALLAGIQYSFYVALAINIVALVLALFVKRVDTSSKAISELNSQESTQMKPAEVK